MSKRYLNNKVLVFGDTHAPFQHKRTIEFLSDMKATHQPDRVIHTGDLTDSYNFSRFAKDIASESISKELTRMREFNQELVKVFPKMTIVKSNHDVRLWQAARIGGIPRECIIPWEKLIGVRGWKLADDFLFTVDADRSKWQVSHHKTGTALTTSQKLGRNVILGHSHTRQGAYRWSPEHGKTLWGVDCGCMIDRKEYAFHYARANALQQVTGCALVVEGVPQIIPMD